MTQEDRQYTRPKAATARLDRLESAARIQARFLLEGESFGAVVERLRITIPSFTNRQYSEAVEAGLISAREDQAENQRNRDDFILKARSESLLVAAFILLRESRRSGAWHDRLGPINVENVLDDLHSIEDIREAVLSAACLLKAGSQCDLSEIDAASRLEREHPGFRPEDYVRAADIGWFASR
ncbi:hypothetical protein [Arthrobacter monumenti]